MKPVDELEIMFAETGELGKIGDISETLRLISARLGSGLALWHLSMGTHMGTQGGGQYLFLGYPAV